MFPIFLIIGSAVIKLATADILVLPFNGRYIEDEFRDMPSTFGNGLPYEGLHGLIVYSNPANACSPVERPPVYNNPTGKWIILIARYGCTFEEKVRNAQTAGFDAAIVHNIGSENLESMSSKNSTGIHIPSVFVGESSGLKLCDFYSYNMSSFVVINSEMPFSFTHLLLPFAVVIGICFLIIIIYVITKFITDRRRQRRDRLSTSALNKVPTCKFQKGDPYETCAICLDDYVEGEKLRVLPCAHAYHSNCIDPWLTKNRRVCPVCKRKVFAQNETPYTDSENESDSDDTRPLLRGNQRGNVTQGGTFETERSDFLRAIRSITQPEVPPSAVNFVRDSSDYHSINGEEVPSDVTVASLLTAAFMESTTSTDTIFSCSSVSSISSTE